MNFFKSKDKGNMEEPKEWQPWKAKKVTNQEIVQKPISQNTKPGEIKQESKSAIPTAMPENDSYMEELLGYIPVEKKYTKNQFKRLINKKLTILLIENTITVDKEKEIVNKIIKSILTSGLVIIINYGSSIWGTDILDIKELEKIDLIYGEDIGEKARLYDALLELEHQVLENYMKIKEKETERININQIEILGVGTGKDNGSTISKEKGIECFCKANKPNIITKYFCLTEENFMDVAEIGFRSIGAIFRNYQ